MEQSGWCPDHAICMDWIERRAFNCVENFIEPDTVYMSTDIYTEFLKQLSLSQVFTGLNPIPNSAANLCIMTSIGSLKVKPISFLCNFCFVGNETSYQRLEWEKIDQEFEKVFFGE